MEALFQSNYHMSINRKILLVEDELSLAFLVKENLEHAQYDVRLCNNGEEALKSFFSFQPDLVLLDVMMPKINGFEVAKTIRNTNRSTPILFLTAKIKSSDVVKGFESGGNDYLRKPFAMDELLIRIQVLLNKERLADEPTKSDQSHFELGNCTFDYHQFIIHKPTGHQSLTAREAELLKLFCENPNKLLSKSSILLNVWGDDSFFNSRSMDVFISKLRKYLADEPKVNLINMRGVGYKLVTD